MSRDSALVSADWAEQNLETSGIVFVEVDEDTTAYDGGHIPGAIKLAWKKDLQDPLGRAAPSAAAPSRGPASATGRRARRTRSAATSSTRSSSRRCCPSAASPTTT